MCPNLKSLETSEGYPWYPRILLEGSERHELMNATKGATKLEEFGMDLRWNPTDLEQNIAPTLGRFSNLTQIHLPTGFGTGLCRQDTDDPSIGPSSISSMHMRRRTTRLAMWMIDEVSKELIAEAPRLETLVIGNLRSSLAHKGKIFWPWAGRVKEFLMLAWPRYQARQGDSYDADENFDAPLFGRFMSEEEGIKDSWKPKLWKDHSWSAVWEFEDVSMQYEEDDPEHNFGGKNAHLRRLKVIQKRIQETGHYPEVKHIHQKYSEGDIFTTIRTLLEAKVFLSEQIAKMRFEKQDFSPSPAAQEPETPVLMTPVSGSPKPASQVSRASDSTGTTFTSTDLLGICLNSLKMNESKVETEKPKEVGEDVAKIKLETAASNPPSQKIEYPRKPRLAWKDFLEISTRSARSPPPSPTSSEDDLDVPNLPVPLKYKPGFPELTKMRTPDPAPRHLNFHSPNMPPQFPPGQQVVLPLRTQHLILTRIQTILEHACFQFAQENMPDILVQNQWDCPEAGELNIWIHFLRGRSNELYDLGRSRVGEFSLHAVFQSIIQIRHNAVHRNRIDVAYLSLLMRHAVIFCAILGVPDALDKIVKIQVSAQQEISKLGDIKNGLEQDLKPKLQDIAVRRAKLDAREQKSITQAHKELEYQRSKACKRLDQVLLGTDMTHLSLGVE
ncbi:hypothetical protein NW762_008828 [Fusarium torreyae]|uniref:Uncharacterized protein n=1 Tax=Fusarium torreyae TaxID=1237075 RepID=A0A9W8RWH5_9HYPO|nr:hypothetical protein NW762_008828 [Fusarium torreyae]